MALRFADVGSTRYTTPTSGIGALEEDICLSRVLAAWDVGAADDNNNN